MHVTVMLTRANCLCQKLTSLPCTYFFLILWWHIYFFSYTLFWAKPFLVQSQKCNRAVLQCKTEAHFSNQAQVISFSLSPPALPLSSCLFVLSDSCLEVLVEVSSKSLWSWCGFCYPLEQEKNETKEVKKKTCPMRATETLSETLTSADSRFASQRGNHPDVVVHCAADKTDFIGRLCGRR